jgi:hypothetical protein
MVKDIEGNAVYKGMPSGAKIPRIRRKIIFPENKKGDPCGSPSRHSS